MTNFEPTKDLIIPYLEGRSISQIVIELNTLAQLHETNALAFFQKPLRLEQQEDLFLRLTKDYLEISLEDYKQWRVNLMLEDNCIHLLEYLSYKGFHRFNYLIKKIHQTKAPWKLHHFYLSAMAGIVVAGIYFTQNQNAWISFLDFLKTSLPHLAIQACDWALNPQNLALSMLLFQILSYLSLAYQILSDNTSSKTHKINQLSHLSLYFVLTSSAQLIIFLNLPVSYMSGLLFIFANFINLAWRLVECYLLNKENNFKKISAITPLHGSAQEMRDTIRLIEQSNHYEKMTQQLYVEGLSLFLTLITGIISIYLGPNIACITTLCASFQFLLNMTKSYYYNIIEQKFAEKLQAKIDRLHQLPSPPSVDTDSINDIPKLA